jgi:hypothetical protein
MLAGMTASSGCGFFGAISRLREKSLIIKLKAKANWVICALYEVAGKKPHVFMSF